MSERLQRVLASAGFGSRRSCEELIRAGRVAVDGVPATLGMSVDPIAQTVTVDKREIVIEVAEYWLLNKPAGVVSTADDPQGRRTVVDCVPTETRVFPVGRLDAATTGLLLITNDGALPHRLLHPSYGVEKEYEVIAQGRMTQATARRLSEGVELEDGVTAPADVHIVSIGRNSVLRLTLHEGRNRQVRRMLEAVGHPVVSLHRGRFGPLTDDGMAVGAVRRLRRPEIEKLKRAVYGGDDPHAKGNEA